MSIPSQAYWREKLNRRKKLRCPYCGLELILKEGMYICPNDGVIE